LTPYLITIDTVALRGHAMAQASSRQPVTAEARVQLPPNPRGILWAMWHGDMCVGMCLVLPLT